MRSSCEPENPGSSARVKWRPDIPFDPAFTYYDKNCGRHRYFRRDPETGLLSEDEGRCFDEHWPADYISAWIEVGDSKQVLKFIDIDLDVSRVHERWLTEDRAEIDASKLSSFLHQHQWLFSKTAYLTRSKRGGIHIVLAISPCVIDEDSNAWKMLNRLQQVIHKFLTLHDLNPDPGALGLKRLMPNFRDGRRVLYANLELLSDLQKRKFNDTGDSKKGNRPVARAMLRAAYRAIRRAAKNRLYSDARVEEKLSRLFLDIYAERKRDGVLRITSNELSKEYRLSSEFIQHQLLVFTQAGQNDKMPWLSFLYCGNGVWELSLQGDTRAYLKRARQVVSGHPDAGPEAHVSDKKSAGRMKNLDLRPPEEIQKGERHRWLVDSILLCKMGLGLCEEETLARVGAAAERVPEFQNSRSIRRLSRIVHSIYRRREDLLGCLSGRIPVPEHLTATGLPPLSVPPKKFSYSSNVFFHSAKCDTYEPVELVCGSPVPSGSEILTETAQTLFLGSPEREPDGRLLPQPLQLKPPRLAVVRYHNRIGVFHQNQLVLLTTSGRSFSASAVLEHIRTSDIRLSRATLWYPKISDKRRPAWVDAMQHPDAVAVPAAVVCGRRATKVEKIQEWREVHGRKDESGIPESDAGWCDDDFVF